MNKKLILGIVILAIILVAFSITSCAREQPEIMPTPELLEGYNWYHNDEFGYKIGYPKNWTVVPKEEIIVGEGIEGAQFIRGPDTFSTIVASIASEYDIQGLKAMGGKDVVINGREGYEVIIQPMPVVKLKIVAFIVNDKYYVISCSTSADLFDEYVAMFDNAINSFAIE